MQLQDPQHQGMSHSSNPSSLLVWSYYLLTDSKILCPLNTCEEKQQCKAYNCFLQLFCALEVSGCIEIPNWWLKVLFTPILKPKASLLWTEALSWKSNKELCLEIDVNNILLFVTTLHRPSGVITLGILHVFFLPFFHFKLIVGLLTLWKKMLQYFRIAL